MTSYRYLGYGTTDANGVAHLKKNASGQDVNGYVGTGAGEVDVIASLDNPISQGSIVSETYSIWDTLQYDGGTINDHNDTIWNNIDYLSRGEEYSTITRDGNEALKFITITGDICIEFDLMTTMGNAAGLLSVRNGSTTLKAITGTDCGGVSNTWKHIKITIIGSKLTLEGSSIVDFDVTNFNRLYFRSASGYQTNFKDLKVYSA